MPTKCIKITLNYNKQNNIEYKDIFKILKDLQYNTWIACNRAMTYFYTNDMQNIIQKDIGLPNKSDKDIYGKSLGAWIENRMNEIIDGALTNNVASTRQFINNRYSNDKKKGLLKGNVSITQFKRNIPLIIHNKAYSFSKSNKGLDVEIGLFNLRKQKELGVKRISFNIPKLNPSEKSIINKLIDGEYKLGTGQLTYNQKKKKWMLIVSFSFEKENNIELNENKVLGIDLGITKVATMSIYNIDTEKYDFLNFKERCIDGKELVHTRQKIEARKRNLSIASKWASDNRQGHGRNTLMKPIYDIGNKYENFRQTYNHKISKYIVKLAIKYKCKKIQMEDLTGFSEEQTNSLLKNWSYYDLQEKIKYKAVELGIEVILINPRYTSKRCSVCGNIHSENRDCKNDQANFTCISCGHHENADINASKNIAIPYIDTIISEYIKEKETIKPKEIELEPKEIELV